MKMTLSRQMAFELAQQCASTVLAAVHTMHNRVADQYLRKGENAALHARDQSRYPYSGVQELRALIASIDDPLDRQVFVGWLRYNFLAQRLERATDVKWQDYLARVQSRHAQREEAA